MQGWDIPEWEHRVMTVCIAAISLCDTGRALIMVADRQFGLGYTSVESKHGKFDNFGPDWYVGFAANNTAYATEVITLGRSRLQNRSPCCARAAIGHAAAAPPMSVMNSRRFIRLARQRAVKTIPGS
jgi:hypothetical protein